nr:FAD-dependent oxidoreductase [Ruegeria sp. HKCCA0370]
MVSKKDGWSRDVLLLPYQLKHLTLKNRIKTTSHEPAYPEDGMPKERYRAYHEMRAKAGVAMTMTAGSATVSRDSPPVFNNVLAYKDEVVRWMAELTDACHAHGCAVMIQLTHLGRRTGWNKGDWLPSVSSSHYREPAHRAFAKKMEDHDIERIVSDYADAAERMKAAGLDGIELQAYGHLIDQFWSPLTNKMDAPYGGSFDNRLRFGFMVLDAIRDRVGQDFIGGVRYTTDEVEKGAITEEDGLEIARRLRDSGQVGFLKVIRGGIHTDPAMTDVIPAANSRRRTVVVGAGPGGLEAARVAHDVAVLEAAPEPGGQVRLAAQSRHRAEKDGIIDWHMAQYAARDVRFQFNTFAEAENVTALSPDMVVIATGGLPEKTILETGKGLAISAWDILSADVPPREIVLIYDDAGDHPALMAAEIIAESGAQVEIMTRDRSFVPEIMGMTLVPYMRALQKTGAVFTVTRTLKSLVRSGNQLEAAIGTDYSDLVEKRMYDQVIVNQGTLPLDDLYFQLKPLSRNRGRVDHDALVANSGDVFPQVDPNAGFDLCRIGDAVFSRNIHAAVYDAQRLGLRW